MGKPRAALGYESIAAVIFLLGSMPSHIRAQDAPDTHTETEVRALRKEVAELRELVLRLQDTIAQLQGSRSAGIRAEIAASPASAPASPVTPAGAAAPDHAPPTPEGGPAPSAAARIGADFLHGLSINALLDTYYEYNFNDPIGRVNRLRAYDVSSNNFSLNQADLLVESAPDMNTGKRFGMRADIQYGQATQSLGGNSTNELRPEIYRNVFQAYGSYWIPIHGSMLMLDFGKWASSIGIEGNYTKDQLNYSRSLWFDFLPFYHSGLRATYKVNEQLSFNYWITNGTQQSEAFNNFKDQLFGFVMAPDPSLSWTFNYYLGQEHPDVIVVPATGTGQQNLPSQQGTLFEPIPNPPDGRLQIFDSYLTWKPTSALTLAAEGDYVTEQLYSSSAYQRVTGAALYAQYQLTPKLALALRGEYLADPAGLYSGAHQYLKEGTFTAQYKLGEGFIAYGEWRRDASDRPYFLTRTLYLLDGHQDTLGFGLLWWIGQKEGPW